MWKRFCPGRSWRRSCVRVRHDQIRDIILQDKVTVVLPQCIDIRSLTQCLCQKEGDPVHELYVLLYILLIGCLPCSVKTRCCLMDYIREVTGYQRDVEAFLSGRELAQVMREEEDGKKYFSDPGHRSEMHCQIQASSWDSAAHS